MEIAYFTREGERRKGYATATARGLVDIARTNLPDVVIEAFMLPERNASTAIHEKLGFEYVGTAHDADAGLVWRCRASPAASP